MMLHVPGWLPRQRLGAVTTAGKFASSLSMLSAESAAGNAAGAADR
jgi:hypothetical protein